jgi:hypothetical protein
LCSSSTVGCHPARTSALPVLASIVIAHSVRARVVMMLWCFAPPRAPRQRTDFRGAGFLWAPPVLHANGLHAEAYRPTAGTRIDRAPPDHSRIS